MRGERSSRQGVKLLYIRDYLYTHAAKEHPTGVLHSDGFESLQYEKIRIPKWVSVFLAEDEGFEPPQTESESGVLPLHKSSI